MRTGTTATAAAERDIERLALIHVQRRPCRVLTLTGLLDVFRVQCNHNH